MYCRFVRVMTSVTQTSEGCYGYQMRKPYSPVRPMIRSLRDFSCIMGTGEINVCSTYINDLFRLKLYPHFFMKCIFTICQANLHTLFNDKCIVYQLKTLTLLAFYWLFWIGKLAKEKSALIRMDMVAPFTGILHYFFFPNEWL